MVKYKALLIPHDPDEPVKYVEIDRDDFREIVALVCADPKEGTFSSSGFPEFHCAFYYDDEYLYTQPENVNIRAMIVWAALAGVHTSNFRQNLCGNHLLVGPADAEGYTLDVPTAIAEKILKAFEPEEGE